jgi:hypothetical protein
VNPLENPALSRYGYFAYRCKQIKRNIIWLRRHPRVATNERGSMRYQLAALAAYRRVLMSGV